MRVRLIPGQPHTAGLLAEKGGGGGGAQKRPKVEPPKPRPKKKAEPVHVIPQRDPATYEKAFNRRLSYLTIALQNAMPEPPPPPPPATETRDEVTEAGRQERRQLRRRRSYLASTFAGETGGFQQGAKQVGTSATLG